MVVLFLKWEQCKPLDEGIATDENNLKSDIVFETTTSVPEGCAAES